MSVDPRVAELEATLRGLVPTLARLSELLIAQRQAVADGELDRLLALTADQEEASARLATLEQRRQTLQLALETELGVRGLRAIGEECARNAPDSALPALVDALQRETVRLHEENGRAAALLTAATEMACRTRAFLARLMGAEVAYPAISASGAPRVDPK